MFCPECGAQLEDRKNHCSKCGWHLEEDSIKSQKSIPNTSIPNDTPISSPDVFTSSPATKVMSNSLKFIMPVAAIITIVLAVIIGVTAHYNSDDYKIQKASELIAAGNYSEGIDEIRDVYTPQAATIKEFVNVEYSLQAFIDSAESNDFEEHRGAYYEFVNEMDLFEQENEVFYLPENLYQNYERYNSALDFSYNYTSTELYDIFRDVQMVMLNMIDFETGKTFTLKDWQNRVETSVKALKKLNTYDFTYVEIIDSNLKSICCTSELYTDSGYKTVVYLNKSLSGIISNMSYYCESEIESCNEFIEGALEMYDQNDELSKKNPDSSYYSYVGSDLGKIFSVDSIHINTNQLTHMIQLDILYYLLVGAASPSY